MMATKWPYEIAAVRLRKYSSSLEMKIVVFPL